jgi:acyl-ACP thioesterase
MVSLAQDLAAAHYGGGGLSIPHLQQRGYTWVITKQRFVINEYPLWLDELEVSTWAKPVKGPFCFRDFAYTYTPNGRHETLNSGLGIAAPVPSTVPPAPILASTSAWMVLDLATGKPIKPDATFFGALEFSDDDALPTGSNFPRFAFPDAPDGGGAPGAVFSPTFLDIDINQHVNNLNYLRWALADTPPEVAQGRVVTEIDTYFLAQARFGDILRVESRVTPGTAPATVGTGAPAECIHRILNTDGDSELFRARTVWRDEAALCRPLVIG